MIGTFLDTIVIIITMTGIVLVLTGVWQSQELAGAALTNYAFSQGLGNNIGATIVTVGLLFFAFTTILGWCYYGERCFVYHGRCQRYQSLSFRFYTFSCLWCFY